MNFVFYSAGLYDMLIMCMFDQDYFIVITINRNPAMKDALIQRLRDSDIIHATYWSRVCNY